MRTFLYNMYKHPGYALLLVVLAVFIGTSMPVRANNIRIEGNPKLRNRDTATESVQIHFDVAWDHSWKTQRPNNWDAAWIFIKCWDGGNWNHVYLVDTVGSYRAGSTNEIDAVSTMKYYVSDREGFKDKLPMKMEPGYSRGYRKWEGDSAGDTASLETLCVGFFLYRAEYGAGDIRVPGVYVTWNYGSQLFQNEDDLTVKVFVVEMVYIPEGGFFVGGRYTRTDKNFYQEGSFTYNATGETTANFDFPFKIDSEDPINCQPTPDDTTLWAMPINGAKSITRGVIPASFPKGFQAFYIMKYELTQQAWCEFINCLNFEQQNARMDIDLSASNLAVYDKTIGPGYYWTGSAVSNVGWKNNMQGLRYYVTVKEIEPFFIFGCNVSTPIGGSNPSVIDETDRVSWGHTWLEDLPQDRNKDGQDVAMYYVSVYDLFAYAEFACLRPMTELEYEKACRGNKQVSGQEFAWGSNELHFYGQAFVDSRYPSEYSTFRFNTSGDLCKGTETVNPFSRTYNCGYTRSCSGYYNQPAPLRVGSFADSVTTRVQAGATYWGVMNMSDNVAEVCISIYDQSGRDFVGVHGCGQLHYATGEIQQKDWHFPTDVNKRQYVIDRGMLFYYSYYGNYNNYSKNQIWGENRDHGVKLANGTFRKEEWPILAGMISSRHRALNSGIQNLTRRDIQGTSSPTSIAFSTAVNYPVMRGIRCVRTDKAER